MARTSKKKSAKLSVTFNDQARAGITLESQGAPRRVISAPICQGFLIFRHWVHGNYSLKTGDEAEEQREIILRHITYYFDVAFINRWCCSSPSLESHGLCDFDQKNEAQVIQCQFLSPGFKTLASSTFYLLKPLFLEASHQALRKHKQPHGKTHVLPDKTLGWALGWQQ